MLHGVSRPTFERGEPPGFNMELAWTGRSVALRAHIHHSDEIGYIRYLILSMARDPKRRRLARIYHDDIQVHILFVDNSSRDP